MVQEAVRRMVPQLSSSFLLNVSTEFTAARSARRRFHKDVTQAVLMPLAREPWEGDFKSTSAQSGSIGLLEI